MFAMLKSNRGPEPGFEPGTEDPQSHMLPGYTIRAMHYFFLFEPQNRPSLYKHIGDEAIKINCIFFDAKSIVYLLIQSRVHQELLLDVKNGFFHQRSFPQRF